MSMDEKSKKLPATPTMKTAKGDSEHDNTLHSRLKPHSGFSQYDPITGKYRHDGD